MASDPRICANPLPKEDEDQAESLLKRIWKRSRLRRVWNWSRSHRTILLLIAIILLQLFLLVQTRIQMEMFAHGFVKEERKYMELFSLTEKLQEENKKLKKELEQRK